MSGLILALDNVNAGKDSARVSADVTITADGSIAALPRPAGAMPNVTDRGRIKFGAGFRNASK